MTFSCPNCKNKVGIDGLGSYECPYCEERFSVDDAKFEKTKTNAPIKKTKKTFSIVYLWIISIVCILFAISSFNVSFFACLFILLSGLILFPPIRKIYSKKINVRLRYVLIISIIFFCIGSFLMPKEYETKRGIATETQRSLPLDLEFSTQDPKLKISYHCVHVRNVKINGSELSETDIDHLCNDNYTTTLKSGENTYSITVVSRDNTINENIKCTFDEEAYIANLEAAKAKAKAIAEQKAKEDAQAVAKAEAAKEIQLNTYAKDYCTNRKSKTRKFGILKFSGSTISAKFNNGTIGKYLTTDKCRAIIDFVINVMEYQDGAVNSSMLNTIIKGNYSMGMNKYYFFASVGNPDDINTSQYGESYTNDQVIYYKDSYGINAQYFYFENNILTSTQDF